MSGEANFYKIRPKGSLGFFVNNTYTLMTYNKHDSFMVKSKLDEKMVVEIPGIKYTYAYRANLRGANERVYRVTNEASAEVTVQFPTGLLPDVMEAFRWPNEFTDGRELPLVKLNQITHPGFNLRDYQYEAIKAAFGQSIQPIGWWPRGIIQVATGGGKTEIAVAMYMMNPVNTMFIVHRKDLMLQAAERFAKYGIDVGILGNGKFDPKPTGVNIVTMQTIASVFRAKERADEELRKAHYQQARPLPGIATSVSDPHSKDSVLTRLIMRTQQVFFDEAHLMAGDLDKGNEFVRIADKFQFASMRWGLTATPFMRSDYDNLLLQGVTGKVIYSISNAELIQRGHLTPPTVVMKRVRAALAIKFEGRYTPAAGGAYYRRVYEEGIEYHMVRNEAIVDEMKNGPYPCLVLCKTMGQATFLQKLADNRGGITMLVSGKTQAKERRNIVAALDQGKIKTLIATTIFDEGVDIPNLRKIILASGGKSQVKQLQRVGRGLRKAAGKTTVEIIDFADAHHPLLKKHADERKAIWEAEGFKVLVELK